MSTEPPKTPKLLPPHYLAISVAAMIALWAAAPDMALLPGFWRFGGTVPLLAGLWVAFQGSRQFSDAGTNIIPFSESTALVTDGVFRRTRNPMYLGMTGFLTGLAVLLNGIAPWFVVVSFAVLLQLAFIKPEEKLMQQTFGATYTDYCAITPRWL